MTVTNGISYVLGSFLPVIVLCVPGEQPIGDFAGMENDTVALLIPFFHV